MKKKRQAPSDSNTKSQTLEQQALSQLNSAHYKEAIGLYKKLWQDSDKDEWREKLAYCYLQRALSFASRGMVKEALVLWENYTQYAQKPYQAYDHYISWLIQTKNISKVQSSLAELTVQQLDKQYPALASLLGLLMLTEYPEFQQNLPQDSAFITDFKVVQIALKAYQDDNQERLNEALKQLPYRSAFRDLRTILTAITTELTSVEKIQILLDKIPPHSPYSKIAGLLFSCTQDGSELTQSLIPFSHKQRKVIAEIKGLNKKQIDLIEYLSRQKIPLSDKIKFNLAIKYQSLYGSEVAQNFCQLMLLSYPAGRRDFKKNFTSINEFEQNRLEALNCEQNENSYKAEHYWRQCVTILAKEAASNGLKIALILRHVAKQHEDEIERIELLIESLQYDPEDLDSYLQILRYFSQPYEDVEDYKKWLAKTLEKFPQQIEVLTLAIQTATANKAYKKASQYAKKILKIDPLNSFAKQILFTSHLAHARRLIQTKKYHLVEKEIQQADDLNLGKACSTKTQLMRGLFYFASQDKKQGLQLFVESLNKLHSNPVNACFQAAMEALLTGLPVATILRELTPAKDHLLSEQGLKQLIQLLTEYESEESNLVLIHKALERIKPALKNSLRQQEYDENLLLHLCQTLDDLNHYELLRHCSKMALRKWREPIWIYWVIYSETNGNPEQCTVWDINRLDAQLELASEKKDHRVMVLINSYLDRYYQVHPESGMGFLDDLFGFDEEEGDDDFEDPIEALFGHVPEQAFNKVNKKLDALFKTTSPEKLIQQLQKVTGNNENILMAMMQNPDVFSALMIIKAADETGVDIDVSVEDIIDYFDINAKNSSSPFPF